MMKEKENLFLDGKIMKLLFGLLLFFWLVIQEIWSLSFNPLSIATVLGILCFFILKEKFFDHLYLSVGLFLIIVGCITLNPNVALLLAIPILHFTYQKHWLICSVASIIGIVISVLLQQPTTLLVLLISALFGYLLGEKTSNEKNYTTLLDEERRLRYRLEETKNKLLHSRKEIETLTEIRERNRIAHEIHDNVGHSITGVIFQIEAARRIIHKQPEKLEQILKLCSEKLTDALQLTRNTVYNLKTVKKTVGKEMLVKLKNDFTFCPLNFQVEGDFSLVSVTNLKVLETLMMESLTNAAKYSQANKIEIKIKIHNKSIRFHYKDNGIGCHDIKENLGLYGMREKVEAVGGIFSVDGMNGFLIVCNIPILKEENN